MKVVVGLGNPGIRYDDTRHNVGWWVLDRLAYDLELGPFGSLGAALVVDGVVAEDPLLLMKPTTYMNRSGAALSLLAPLGGLSVSEDLLIVVDDGGLDLGRIRFRAKGGSGGHHGLASIEEALGTGSYGRLRVGVGSPPPGTSMEDWVLSPFSKEDEDVIVDLLPELSRAIRCWLEDGIEEAMNRFNR